jgi:CBS domain-containing protein
MKAEKLMTADPAVVLADDTVIDAAKIMREVDVGLVPVVDSEDARHLIGVITDRDIVTRCVAEGHRLEQCTVRDHMSPSPVVTARPDEEVHQVTQSMELAQIRRIPVVDKKGRLVGVVAQADIAVEVGPKEPTVTAHLLEEVSQPGQQQLS